MRFLTAITALTLTMSAHAQQRVGDFVESRSNYDERPSMERVLQYYPEDRGFVCLNGKNRYTRALYGSHTDWRLETSDRPVFAVVKKGHHRNISLTAIIGGQDYPLDSTSYCKARYADGQRTYILQDTRWPKGATLTIATMAMAEAEGGWWRFAGSKFPHPVTIRAVVKPIAARKLSRNGDLGADKPGVLEPKSDAEPLQVVEWQLGAGHDLLAVEFDSLRLVGPDEGQALVNSTEKHFRELAARIQFHTPNAYINALGNALTLAADGDWDGKTWLHGCIGWRMPLAGWRAGYLGDVLGWPERAKSHFEAYAKSQVDNVEPTLPHPTQDPKMNMARAEKRWGTQMYSNGYICRNPERNDQMHHYDMNLNYIDELLWHFQYDADPEELRRYWPVLTSHLAWEKRNYDPDGDHLYDAYCCIWASDALYYSGGAVTHSSAYNYRGNLLAARIAELIGENPKPYREEAEAILNAMNQRLWVSTPSQQTHSGGSGFFPHWAEYQDAMGLKRLHESAALWSIYTPIDCGACSPEQAYQATRYVDNDIPHFALPASPGNEDDFHTLATSNWLPYSWSINNVAAAEVMHTALAYFEAGRADEAFRILMGNVMDQMYFGQSPANFGQLSHYDAARGECYRDFGDCIGISSRTLLQGLFGIQPQALYGKCVIRPGFPEEWDSASVTTPYIHYSYTRTREEIVLDITQHFRQPMKMVLRLNTGEGKWRDIEGTDQEHQVIRIRRGLETIDMAKTFNADVTDIFRQEYRSPRPKATTLQIPLQGIGEWCHPQLSADINDSVFRSRAVGDCITVAGIPFNTPQHGNNIAYASLWDNWPNTVKLPMKGQRATAAHLLMAGSTNHMQSRIANGQVVAEYKDGSADTLLLTNPDNWCPIEQDYYVDDRAFCTNQPRPWRIAFGTGDVSRNLGRKIGIKGVYGREIPGGAAQVLRMKLNPDKKLKSITLCPLSNDVVMGLMAVTLEHQMPTPRL